MADKNSSELPNASSSAQKPVPNMTYSAQTSLVASPYGFTYLVVPKEDSVKVSYNTDSKTKMAATANAEPSNSADEPLYDFPIAQDEAAPQTKKPFDERLAERIAAFRKNPPQSKSPTHPEEYAEIQRRLQEKIRLLNAVPEDTEKKQKGTIDFETEFALWTSPQEGDDEEMKAKKEARLAAFRSFFKDHKKQYPDDKLKDAFIVFLSQIPGSGVTATKHGYDVTGAIMNGTFQSPEALKLRAMYGAGTWAMPKAKKAKAPKLEKVKASARTVEAASGEPQIQRTPEQEKTHRRYTKATQRFNRIATAQHKKKTEGGILTRTLNKIKSALSISGSKQNTAVGQANKTGLQRITPIAVTSALAALLLAVVAVKKAVGNDEAVPTSNKPTVNKTMTTEGPAPLIKVGNITSQAGSGVDTISEQKAEAPKNETKAPEEKTPAVKKQTPSTKAPSTHRGGLKAVAAEGTPKTESGPSTATAAASLSVKGKYSRFTPG